LIPFEMGAHAAMNSTFEILHFEEKLRRTSCTSRGCSAALPGGTKELTRYRRVFDQLRAIALGPRDSNGPGSKRSAQNSPTKGSAENLGGSLR